MEAVCAAQLALVARAPGRREALVTSKLTILHTIETSGPGGAENVLLQLASRLSPDRFRSVVVINEPGWLEDKLHEAGLQTVRVKWRRWWDCRLPRAIARLVKDERVDLIHSHLPDQNFYACVASRLSGCPTIVTYHGPVELSDSGTLRGWLKLQLVKNTARKVVVVCDFVKDMLKHSGFTEQALHRIYNGIESSRFTEATRGRLRLELNCPPESALIGMLANVRAPKGHEFFIRAARLIADRNPNTFFVISGDLHKTLAPPLFKLVRDLGLQDRLKFLGFREDVPTILSDLDIFVLPSTSEGFPLVVLEAMACGKPVVATRCGGAGEAVVEGRTGFMVEVADAPAIASRVIELLEQKEQSVSMGQAAKLRIESEFSVQAMVANYERLYESCVALRGADLKRTGSVQVAEPPVC
jgi:glycosyltransferase involved in cell wall biosynthesis